MSIEASVIVPTYNGEKKISNVLDALLKQTFKVFEVIVVIDGSTDDTQEIVERYRSSFSKLKIVIQSNQGRSRVRNRGVQEAVSDLIIFYDDDMIPFDDSIERHISFHKVHQGIVTGFSIEQSSSDKTDIQNYKAHLTAVWTQKYTEGLTQLNESNLFFAAANASMRKEVFFKLNGFDERLTDAEDQDLAYRALKDNIPVFFDKQNKAIHNDPITCRLYIRRLRLYAKAHARLKEYHPDLYSNSSEEKNLVKRMIYRSFAMSFWVALIDRQIFKFFLPKKIRFKFYSVVIQALSVEYPQVRI